MINPHTEILRQWSLIKPFFARSSVKTAQEDGRPSLFLCASPPHCTGGTSLGLGGAGHTSMIARVERTLLPRFRRDNYLGVRRDLCECRGRRQMQCQCVGRNKVVAEFV
ncbi:hypothetical protein HG531_011965 [Fusarium graminearum]|nr:hypothetical protein HG531_011965 [Fusarium graminearum]